MVEPSPQRENPPASQDDQGDIDESLYSRQLYLMGADNMKRLFSASVLISGLNGLGAEIAKNLILAGVKAVVLHDSQGVQPSDLASNFCLSEESLARSTRAHESRPTLAALNGYVLVSAVSGQLTEGLLVEQNINCVVICDHRPASEIRAISHFCHEKGIYFFLTETMGLFGYVFVDNGPKYCSLDPFGRKPSRFLLSNISKAERALVTVAQGEYHDLDDGDGVWFEEIEGMTELNFRSCRKSFEVEVVSGKEFYINCDTREFGDYTSQFRSGYGNQQLQPKMMDFLSLSEAIMSRDNFEASFEFPFDENAEARERQVVLAFLAVHHVLQNKSEDWLSLSSERRKEDILIAARALIEGTHLVDSVDVELMHEFAREWGAVISPMCAALGGITGQEVIKAITAQFTPLHQFLAVSYLDALPPSPINFEPRGDRYDPYRQVFGNAQQEVMQNLRYFMIGAGAIGCEQLKNWAMMGVATSEGTGMIWVTDMDQIERSNLNRQFLFRDSDIGKMKSEVAARAVKAMNKELQIEAHCNRMGDESTGIYHDEFYEKLSGVCNALDNQETRVFSDRQCVRYSRPLLESGTSGTIAHMHIIIPDLTENYELQHHVVGKEIAICTLHRFPSTNEHTCVWARDLFGGIFEKQPQMVNSFLAREVDIRKLHRDDPTVLSSILKAVRELMVSHVATSFDDCVAWARLKFEGLFNEEIRALTKVFPIDARTEEGQPFWTGAKRFPHPIEYDPANSYHQQFITAAASLHARVCGIEPEDGAPARAALVRVDSHMTQGADITMDAMIAELTPLIGSERRFASLPFDKDNNSNGHMDFVASAANIRAINYRIEPKDKVELKQIAGKIVPAIATTTAMVCGFIALEMYKVHSIVPKKIEDFRWIFFDLAFNQYRAILPPACSRTVCPANNREWTLWTKWTIEGDLTLDQFIQAMNQQFGLNPRMLAAGSGLSSWVIYNERAKDALQLQKKVTQIVSEHGQSLSAGQNSILIRAIFSGGIQAPAFLLKVH